MRYKQYKTYAKNRSPRLKGFDYSTNRPYFVTICTKEGMSVLKGAFALEAIQCLKQLREKYRLKVFAYCVMPEHIHLLLAPGNNKVSISRIIQGFKSMTTRLYNLNGRHEKLWQRYFYDHIVRREEDLNHVALYILENPVRKGLARRWEEWPYCGIVDPIE